MKKIIVMLLVLTVCVSGVFAEDVIPPSVKGTSLAKGADQVASMTMHFNPINSGVSYFNIGFAKADSTIAVGSDGHLENADSNLITAEGITLQRVETSTEDNPANRITGSTSFKVYYEVITTDAVSIKLQFNPFTLDSYSLPFSYTKGSESAKVTENNTNVDLKTITTADTEKTSLFAEVISFGIKTEDASKLKAGEYKSNVIVKITHEN